MNNICLVVDTSGSMATIIDEVNQIAKELVGQMKDCIVGVVTFSTGVQPVVMPTYARNVQLKQFYAGGQTALFDAVAESVNIIDSGNKDDTHLLMVLTDGEENASIRNNAQKIAKLIEDKQKLGNWTFAFQLPPNSAKGFSSRFGIPLENCREWESTKKGVKELAASAASGVDNYLRAVNSGQKAVRSFYLSTDLSKVTDKTLNKKLNDVSAEYKLYEVKQESRIDEFVSSKTKKDYVVGSCFYELMKPEKLQPNKHVLIQDRNTKAIYGGKAARELIGLPTDGISHAKVKPGNHCNYILFVQSGSVNRILPRGTKILVNPTFTKGIQPTWDHTAVQP